MSTALLLSWREGVTASADGEGALVVQGAWGRVSLRQVPFEIREALHELDPPGSTRTGWVNGAGDADLFARAAGTDYYAETSVGEFLLGSPRSERVGRVC